jgi:hypothetical protein
MTPKLEATISDLVSSFLYYDRKEDRDLPRGAIEQMVKDGVTTPDEIVALFAGYLKMSLK